MEPWNQWSDFHPFHSFAFQYVARSLSLSLTLVCSFAFVSHRFARKMHSYFMADAKHKRNFFMCKKYGKEVYAHGTHTTTNEWVKHRWKCAELNTIPWCVLLMLECASLPWAPCETSKNHTHTHSLSSPLRSRYQFTVFLDLSFARSFASALLVITSNNNFNQC